VFINQPFASLSESAMPIGVVPYHTSLRCYPVTLYGLFLADLPSNPTKHALDRST